MAVHTTCRTAEARLREIGTALLHPHPDLLNHSEAQLREIAVWLQAEIKRIPKGASLDPEVRDAAKALRQTARRLNAQIDYASNLCLGWAQLRLSTGYTSDGRPLLAATEAQSTFEG